MLEIDISSNLLALAAPVLLFVLYVIFEFAPMLRVTPVSILLRSVNEYVSSIWRSTSMEGKTESKLTDSIETALCYFKIREDALRKEHLARHSNSYNWYYQERKIEYHSATSLAEYLIFGLFVALTGLLIIVALQHVHEIASVIFSMIVRVVPFLPVALVFVLLALCVSILSSNMHKYEYSYEGSGLGGGVFSAETLDNVEREVISLSEMVGENAVNLADKIQGDQDLKQAELSPPSVTPGITEFALAIKDDALKRIGGNIKKVNLLHCLGFGVSLTLFTVTVCTFLYVFVVSGFSNIPGGIVNATLGAVFGASTMKTLSWARSSNIAIAQFYSLQAQANVNLEEAERLSDENARKKARDAAWASFRKGLNDLDKNEKDSRKTSK